MLVVLDMTDNVDKMRHGQEALQSSTHREHATNNPRGHGRRVQYFAKTFSLQADNVEVEVSSPLSEMPPPPHNPDMGAIEQGFGGGPFIDVRFEFEFTFLQEPFI